MLPLRRKNRDGADGQVFATIPDQLVFSNAPGSARSSAAKGRPGGSPAHSDLSDRPTSDFVSDLILEIKVPFLMAEANRTSSRRGVENRYCHVISNGGRFF